MKSSPLNKLCIESRPTGGLLKGPPLNIYWKLFTETTHPSFYSIEEETVHQTVWGIGGGERVVLSTYSEVTHNVKIWMSSPAAAASSKSGKCLELNGISHHRRISVSTLWARIRPWDFVGNANNKLLCEGEPSPITISEIQHQMGANMWRCSRVSTGAAAAPSWVNDNESCQRVAKVEEATDKWNKFRVSRSCARVCVCFNM